MTVPRSRKSQHRALIRKVTDEEYAERLELQHGGCAICGAKPKTRRLHVDHDHRTMRVRGLLCHRCNRALPSWVDRDWLNNAWHYLLRFELRRD